MEQNITQPQPNNNDTTALVIDEYTKESEALADSPELKKMFLILKNCINHPADYTILLMINDLRRIIKYHVTNPDECIALIKKGYPVIDNDIENFCCENVCDLPAAYEEEIMSNTVFILCVKEISIIDDSSVFKTLLNLEPFNRQLHNRAQGRFYSELKKYCNDSVSMQESRDTREQIDENLKRITIPEKILNSLQTITCINGKPFIENATVKPLKWLQNKQLLRELLTHEKIKGKITNAEIERLTPIFFIDETGKSMTLAKPKKLKEPRDHSRLMNILATL
jgi:hypothetical protein